MVDTDPGCGSSSWCVFNEWPRGVRLPGLETEPTNALSGFLRRTSARGRPERRYGASAEVAG